ncbi:hypothetical protein [Lewinella sp. 4G2]|uniref:hypothetical protein n=1 Tax=Lewinella sp. 4G2 TaxID=1803372 RepID=UPI0012FCDD71|nr:hypothetical protein [Lewinella sp. 4G2]
MSDTDLFILYGYAAALIALVLVSFYKGWLHHKYLYLNDVDRVEPFAASFTPWGWSLGNQLYMLPVLPRRSPVEGNSMEVSLYGRIKTVTIILLVLWVIAISPALLILF